MKRKNTDTNWTLGRDSNADIQEQPSAAEPETLSREAVCEVLEPIYFPERIVSQSLTAAEDGQFRTEVMFPPYDKISCDGEHVSASQISEALIESMYLALAFTVARGRFPVAVPADWFTTCAEHLLMFRSSLVYRKELHPNKRYLLTTELVSVGERRLRRRFLALIFQHSGFVSGEIEYLLDFNYVPQLFVQPQ